MSFTLACPLVFLALPHSMRMAKVRWIHIQRISAYSIIMLLWTLFFCIMTHTVLNMPDSVVITPLRGPLRQFTNILIMLIVPMQMFWWYSAIVQYLRMEDHWKIWLSVAVIALLFSIAVMFYTYPDRIIHLVEIYKNSAINSDDRSVETVTSDPLTFAVELLLRIEDPVPEGRYGKPLIPRRIWYRFDRGDAQGMRVGTLRPHGILLHIGCARRMVDLRES